MMLVKNIWSVVFILGYCSVPVQGQSSAGNPPVLSLDEKVLTANKKLVRSADVSIMPAYRQLLADAAKALALKTVSVMEKSNFPPSGNKHDYMSIAPYFWPDSSKPGGVPYMNRDGQINPEVKQYMDKIYLAEVCEAVSTLGLAWYFSGDKKYATHAGKLLRTWFLDTATKMNPNLNFAQAVKGRTTGRGYGLIDTRHFIKLIDGIGLLSNSPGLTKKDHSGLQQWFTDFLQWMQTSKNGIEEMNTKNNHAVWYDQQRLCFALFTGQQELAKAVVASARERLEKQMNDSGEFPRELERTISLHYTVFVLDPFFTIADLAANLDLDLWSYTTASGKSLKKGFDVLLPYLLKEKQWQHPQILPFSYQEAVPLLVKGAEKYNCASCKTGAREILGNKAASERMNLTTNINLSTN